ncbi:hypothetical protein BC827DRAFT_1220621, partial [Russula dissimulans]
RCRCRCPTAPWGPPNTNIDHVLDRVCYSNIDATGGVDESPTAQRSSLLHTSPPPNAL